MDLYAKVTMAASENTAGLVADIIEAAKKRGATVKELKDAFGVVDSLIDDKAIRMTLDDLQVEVPGKNK